jgi:hypothetical protein
MACIRCGHACLSNTRTEGRDVVQEDKEKEDDKKDD